LAIRKVLILFLFSEINIHFICHTSFRGQKVNAAALSHYFNLLYLYFAFAHSPAAGLGRQASCNKPPA